MSSSFSHRRSRTAWLAVVLLLLPGLTYAPTVERRYGFRDDYPLLHEAHSEPGKILRVCAMQGRIFYGWLLENSLHAAELIPNLRWLRWMGVWCLGLLAALAGWLLLRAGWEPPWAFALAASFVLMPSAQVLASWAICWPLALSLCLGALAFGAAEQSSRTSNRLLWLLFQALAVVLLVGSALLYQPNCHVFSVLVFAALWTREEEPLGDSVRWLLQRLTVGALGLAFAWGVTKLTFAAGLFAPSSRIRFESKPFDKLLWAAKTVFPDALAQPFLGRQTGGWLAAYVLTVAAVVSLGLAGAVQLRTRRPGLGNLCLAGLCVFPVVTYSISLLASERWPTYRSLYALAALCSVFAIAGARELLRGASALKAWSITAPLVLLLAILAGRQTFTLFAVPQGNELALMEEGVRKIVTMDRPSVFVVAADQSDTSAPRRSRDEFGSVSMDAGWIIRDVMYLLARELRPDVSDPASLYRLGAAPMTPKPGAFDWVIDLQRLRALRP